MAIITVGPIAVAQPLNAFHPLFGVLFYLNGFLNTLTYGLLSRPVRAIAKSRTRQGATQELQTSFSVTFEPRVEVVEVSGFSGNGAMTLDARLQAAYERWFLFIILAFIQEVTYGRTAVKKFRWIIKVRICIKLQKSNLQKTVPIHPKNITKTSRKHHQNIQNIPKSSRKHTPRIQKTSPKHPENITK